MKILYLITGLGMGGAEKVVTNLADNMYELGHEVIIVFMVGNPKVLPKNNIKIINLSFKKNPLKAFFYFLKIVKNFSPNIIHSNMYHANLLARFSRIFYKVPKLICSSHSDFEGGKIRMLIYRLTNFLVTISTNVSEQAKNKMVSSGYFNEEDMVVVHNSIDTNIFKFDKNIRKKYRECYSLSTQDVCLLAIGRFHPAKDYETLIKVVSKLVRKNYNIKLFIAGDGPLKNNILEKISLYNLENNIILLGIREDVPNLLSMCDIFISTSAWEGFGLVLAEAMSSSRLVLASRNSGFIEVLGANSKFLVNVGDVDGFTAKIEYLINLDNKRKYELEDNNRQRICNEFAVSSIINEWLKLYER
ncbi:glycosyltransferase [Acinetobacter radioresistens]|uniref:glycosyltransferase n=1 Tax=Acinetobacter radioresistens TaxID=40216 RepID=UPI002246FE0F|nr:glycosyltransferase [Acinetobacter radioresistens]MCX0336956.1 glycosyltransferase [Acinetobacter radioresistens]